MEKCPQWSEGLRGSLSLVTRPGLDCVSPSLNSSCGTSQPPTFPGRIVWPGALDTLCCLSITAAHAYCPLFSKTEKVTRSDVSSLGEPLRASLPLVPQNLWDQQALPSEAVSSVSRSLLCPRPCRPRLLHSALLSAPLPRVLRAGWTECRGMSQVRPPGTCEPPSSHAHQGRCEERLMRAQARL